MTATRSGPAEFGLALLLFLVWKLGDVFSSAHASGAYTHANSLWRAERAIGFPAEVHVQHWLVAVHLGEFADRYYVLGHLPVMTGLALWLFMRHRASYGRARLVVMAATLVCFLLQLYAVAPPRLVRNFGLRDLAAADGSSVYAGHSFANELSSLPSVHVLWAVLVAVIVVVEARSRWRWLVLVHPLLTVLVVVGTGNHYWFDGVAAVLVAAASYPLDRLDRPA